MKLLYATDGSDTALAALDFLLRLPLPEHSEVVVVTVIDREAFPERPVAELDEEERRAFSETELAIRHDADEVLATAAARLRKAGRGGSTEIRSGHPADQIRQAAADHGADLVVVGSHGRTGIRRAILGSVSGSVLQYAGCSVLVVPNPDASERPPPSPSQRLRILIAFDASAPARKALDLCASLPLKDRAQVTILRILPLVTLYRQDIAQRLSRAFQQEKKAAKESLASALEQIHWATPDADTLLLESPDVGKTMLKTATERESDLIVLGHKGRSGIERVLLGSVVGRVASHAPCAVLAVR
jgi:nucleotide-binding universal stress UspA family protein